MFEMFQHNNFIQYYQLSNFAQILKLPQSDILNFRKMLPDPDNIAIDEQEFTRIFTILYKENGLFNWMNDLCRPYKGLEEAVENEATFNRRRALAKKGRLLTDPEVEKIINQFDLDDLVAEGFRVTYLDLHDKNKLNEDFLERLLQKYGIQNPLAKMIISKMRNFTMTIPLEKFIEIFSLFTQPKLTRNRNEFLFSLFSNTDTSISVYF